MALKIIFTQYNLSNIFAMTKLLAITLRIIAITIMAKKLIDYCNNQ